jgi:integrase
MATLKHALTKAVTWKMIRKSVREDLREVRNDKEPAGRLRYLASPDEAQQLIQACHGPFRAVVVTALHTGMRRSEILRLTWKEVDLKRRVIRLTETKNGEPREIPINETVHSLLTGWRTRIDVDWVFHNMDGHQLRDTHKRFEAACKRAGLHDFHFHDLRHTFASWLVMGGVPLPTVSKLMGHKSVSMTMRYAHLSPDHFQGAVQVLDKNLTIGGLEGRNEGGASVKTGTV